MSSENWPQAQKCFRQAIALSQTHYNAWFGLGLIDFRQEKWSSARYHLSKALSLNPNNSVLRCYLGMVRIPPHSQPTHH